MHLTEVNERLPGDDVHLMAAMMEVLSSLVDFHVQLKLLTELIHQKSFCLLTEKEVILFHVAPL